MKKLVTIMILAALVAAGSVIKAQDRPPEYLGLPGDNLNLYAVMNLFQNSKTLEDFERDLNDKKSGINNLDLNGDRKVDYLTVTDNVNGNVHNIVIQDALSRNDVQDVAVFTVERLSNGGVQIQLTGDEALYGRNYIIEPIYAGQGYGTPNPGYTGDNTGNVTIVQTSPVLIAEWPLIRFIYSPRYISWHSRWYWGYYPDYWYSWEPYYWDYYYGFHYNWYNDYYVNYHLCSYHRYRDWDDVYYNHERHYSSYVNDRIHSGYYRETYSHPESRREGEQAYNRISHDSNRRSGPSTLSGYNAGRSENRISNESRSSGNSNSGNRSVLRTNDDRRSNSSGRTSSGTKETNNKKYLSGENNRFAYNQHSSQSSVSGNRNGSGSGQRSSQSSVNNSASNRQVNPGSDNRSSSHQSFSEGRSLGQTRSSGNVSHNNGVSRSSSSINHSPSSKSGSGDVSHRSGVSKSSSSGAHSSSSKSNSGNSSKNEKEKGSSDRR